MYHFHLFNDILIYSEQTKTGCVRFVPTTLVGRLYRFSLYIVCLTP